ncbi:hypothetical protein V8E55_011190 [Tylopilus felleus]
MVVSTARKKSAKFATKYKEDTAPKQSLTHPPWTDMITECIMTTPDGTRHGVSRPAIKKFVDSKYHLSMDPVTTSQLNRAIMHGTLSGNFVLPKGPSGKVKLAAKRVGEIAKENKKPIQTKSRGRAVSTATKTPPFAAGQASKSMPRTRKYISMAKKARVTPIPGRQVSSRKATMQWAGAERVLTRSRATAARTRSATREAAKSKKRASK